MPLIDTREGASLLEYLVRKARTGTIFLSTMGAPRGHPWTCHWIVFRESNASPSRRPRLCTISHHLHTHQLSFSAHHALRRLGCAPLPLGSRCTDPAKGVQSPLSCCARQRPGAQSRVLWPSYHDLLRTLVGARRQVPHLHSLLGHPSAQPVHAQLQQASRSRQIRGFDPHRWSTSCVSAAPDEMFCP